MTFYFLSIPGPLNPSSLNPAKQNEFFCLVPFDIFTTKAANFIIWESQIGKEPAVNWVHVVGVVVKKNFVFFRKFMFLSGITLSIKSCKLANNGTAAKRVILNKLTAKVMTTFNIQLPHAHFYVLVTDFSICGFMSPLPFYRTFPALCFGVLSDDVPTLSFAHPAHGKTSHTRISDQPVATCRFVMMEQRLVVNESAQC